MLNECAKLVHRNYFFCTAFQFAGYGAMPRQEVGMLRPLHFRKNFKKFIFVIGQHLDKDPASLCALVGSAKKVCHYIIIMHLYVGWLLGLGCITFCNNITTQRGSNFLSKVGTTHKQASKQHTFIRSDNYYGLNSFINEFQCACLLAFPHFVQHCALK